MTGRGIHKNDRPGDCSICKKRCRTQRSLKQHEDACRRREEREQRDQQVAEEIFRQEREGRKRKRARIHQPSPLALHTELPTPIEGTGPSRSGAEELPHNEEQPGTLSGVAMDTAIDVPLAFAQDSLTAPSLPLQAAPVPSPAPEPSRIPPRPSPSLAPSTSSPDEPPQKDDIKVEYHPRSGLGTKVFHFNDFIRERSATELDFTSKPWHPFACRDDFDFAEAVLRGGMNEEQIKVVLDIVNRVAQGHSDFSFQTYHDLEQTWEQAATLYPGFTKHTINVPYDGKSHTFEVLARDVEQLIKLQLEDPKLTQYFQWDSRRMSKWDGEKWEMFVEPEPCTGSYMWSAQTSIPEGGKPLGIYLYADKNKLSTFGTQQGYPVVMRLCNIEARVRHGVGLGGGHVVGFLPLVQETAEWKGKTSFANFKRRVWHEAIGKILEPLIPLSKWGLTVHCGDQVERCFYPFGNIFAGDYEEQACMCLLRGNNCLFPCPACLVPHEEMKYLAKNWDERVMEQAKQILSLRLAGDREKAGKNLGLRPFENVMWSLENTDPHKASSFDELHYLGSGIFGYHALKELRTRLDALGEAGRDFSVQLDHGVKNIPRWRNLTHFERGFTTIKFTDGSKYDDLAKVIVFGSYNVFSKTEYPREYTLMRLIRNYTKCKTLAGLEIHTESTLQALEHAILTFGDILLEYDKFGENDVKPKDWNVIKVHILKHTIRDIRLKGTLLSMTTKQSEKFHGPMRKHYLLRTNFKYVMEQLAKWDHRFFCADIIRENIEAWDKLIQTELEAQEKAQQEQDESNSTGKDKAEFCWHQIYLGGPYPPTTFADLEAMHAGDAAFTRFRIKLHKFLKAFLNHPANRIASEWENEPEDYQYTAKLTPEDTITECRLLQVDYESTVTCELEEDYLRCNPSFHHHARYDTVIFKDADSSSTFARLICTFVCYTDKHRIPMALVQPFKAVNTNGPISIVDIDFDFYRLKIQDRKDSRFIPLRAVERGALLAQDSERHDEYIVIDTVDADMYLRIRAMYPNHYT